MDGAVLGVHRGVLRVVLVIALALGCSTSHAQPRQLLATGDAVAGLGRIGTGGFSLWSFADDGRARITGELSDGRRGVFWAGEAGLRRCGSATPHRPPRYTLCVVASRGGYVAIPIYVDGSFSSIAVGGRSEKAALAPDGSALYVTVLATAPGHVAVIDTATNEVSATILSGDSPIDVAVAAAPSLAESSGTSSGGCMMVQQHAPWRPWTPMAMAIALLCLRRGRGGSGWACLTP